MLISQRKLTRIKNRANKGGIPFNLELADVPLPTHCPILGLPFDQYNKPTVDRIVPALGYVKGNVIVISDLANRIKTNATPQQIHSVAHFYMELCSNDYPLFH